LSDSARELFAEYADAHARGERPRAREFIDRAAAGEREPLAELIDRYVAAVPARPATEEDVLALEALVAREPPLVTLRTRRRLTRAQVVDALLAALGLPAQKRAPLALRYHELETAQLDASRVDRRVWDALATALKARADELARWSRPAPPPLAPAAAPHAAFFRAEVAAAAAEPPAPADERDPEVDALFGVPAAPA
jgi:hypothetical protein